MKNLIFLLLFFPLIGLSQPEFSFDLYFEDALGNRDTVTIGYDPEATDGIDAQFGEENIISQPWDSVLDVRIGNKTYTENTWLTDNSFLSKKQIISSYCENSIISSRISIQFYAKNYPIKFKWDKSQFENDSCRFFSALFGKQDALTIDAWEGTFLQYNDSTIYKPVVLPSNQTVLYSHYVSEFNGQLSTGYPISSYTSFDKEIGVTQFVFYSLRAASLDDKSIVQPKIFPNPINRNSNLHISSGEKYELYSVHGNKLRHGSVENKIVSLENIPPGVYYIHVKAGNELFRKMLTIF
jgi:hypothetical protein